MGWNVVAMGLKNESGQAWNPSVGDSRSIEGVRTRPWNWCHWRHRVGSHAIKTWIDAGFITLSFRFEDRRAAQNSTAPPVFNPPNELDACLFFVATSGSPTVRSGWLDDSHAVPAGETGVNLVSAVFRSRLTFNHSLADSVAGINTKTEVRMLT